MNDVIVKMMDDEWGVNGTGNEDSFVMIVNE